MQAGDRITWAFTPRGGYGFVIPVAGVVKRITAKRATIEVVKKVGTDWVRERKSVSLAKIKPRVGTCPELGE
jgi:hypothetical protein